MEAYNKWRKMVFDVAKVGFKELCSDQKYVETGTKYIKFIDYSGRYNTQGICSCSTDDFNSFSMYPHACLSGTTTPGTTFRTKDLSIYEINKIAVAFCTTGAFYTIHSNFFLFTIEGIKIAYAPEKKKFFMNDGYDHKKQRCVYCTYRDMATDDKFSIQSDYIYCQTHPDSDLHSLGVWDGIGFYSPLKDYLYKTIPKLINLYKNNEELYNDAIDEICDEYE